MYKEPDAPSSAPEFAVVNQAPGSATVSWATVGSSNNNAFTAYVLSYKEASGSWTVFKNNIGTGVSSTVVTGLSSNGGEAYTFRVAGA